MAVNAADNSAPLRFNGALLTRPPLTRFDALATLQHLAIVSYAVDPARVRPHVHPRFDIDAFIDSPAGRQALVSMVPFEDQDFHFVGTPWMKHRFGQTNYRTYVIDRETGERAVWFFGTTLDSWTVVLPRYWWRMPWHRGRIRFDCAYDSATTRYTRYRMNAVSDWAAVELELEDTGQPCTELCGMGDFESGLVTLTHPLRGVYFRRDGKLGSYRIWHERLRCNAGRCLKARIELFDRLGVVPYNEQMQPHSVLIQHSTEFAIYLPPRPLPP
ncbi:MAG: DUF2071 domain-containing protein [Pirellulales bacterium]